MLNVMNEKSGIAPALPPRQPSGPRNRFWGLSHLPRLRGDILGYVKELVTAHGDVVSYHIGPIRIYLFNHPEAIHEILVKQAKRFQKPKRIKRVWHKFTGNGLIVSDGDVWRKQRQRMQPAFALERLRGYADVAAGLTEQMLDRWHGRGEHGCLELNIEPEVTRLTLEIVARTLFGANVEEHVTRIGEAVTILQRNAVSEMRSAVTLPDWLPLPEKIRKRRAIRYLHGLIEEMIRQRRLSGEDRGDLLSMLLLAADEEGSGGMSDRQARDEAITLFLAGHETTATALSWALYLLAKHPDEQARVTAEACAVLGDRPATLADLSRLPQTERVFKETLRLYPSIYFFSRQVVEDVDIAGYRLRPGSYCHIFPYLVQRDGRWFARPDEFRPQRFAGAEAQGETPHAYFPFGMGPRVCIGKAFAMMEGVLILATLLRRYRFALAPGQGEPERETLISLRPRGGVRLEVTAKSCHSAAISS